MFFSSIDNVSVNVELLAPSHPFVIVLNSQDLRGNRLTRPMIFFSLIAPWELILQFRFVQKK